MTSFKQCLDKMANTLYLPDNIDVQPANKMAKIDSPPVNSEETRPMRMVIPKHQWVMAGAKPCRLPISIKTLKYLSILKYCPSILEITSHCAVVQ